MNEKMNNDKSLIDKFPITEVLLSENNAIVTREGSLDVFEGTHEYIISNLTTQLYIASMHIIILDDREGLVKLQNPLSLPNRRITGYGDHIVSHHVPH